MSQLRVQSEGADRRWGRGRAGPVTAFRELDRYAFDVRGYLIFENVLDRATVSALLAAIDARRLPPADHTIERQRFGHAGELFGWGRGFCDLIDHPLALAVVAELIGPYARLDHAYGLTMSPGTEGLGLHGPADPFDPSQYYVHRLGVMRSGLLTLTWSLTDSWPGDGGFGCIPGSHRAGYPVPAGADALVQEIPLPAGSLLVFTEALAHCTIPWHGTDTRWALLYKYAPGSTAWSHGPAAPPDVVAGMTPRQQRFFQPPYVGGRSPTIDG
jgi:ectoine hydroxylase-related dioxygenase (phytanoyl-CoA dioxygenase family)